MRRIGQVGKLGLFKRIGSEFSQVVKPAYGQAKQGASKRLASTVTDEFGDDDEGEPMPAPTKAEVVEAIEGMYDVLRSCPRSYGVESALAGLAECAGELAEGEEPSRRQLRRAYREMNQLSRQSQRSLNRMDRALDDGDDGDEAAEGLVHIGNVGDLDWGLSDPFRGESDEYDPYYGNQFHPGYDADDQFGSNYAPRRRGR